MRSLFLVLLLTGCGGLVGSGKRVAEARTVSAFSSLRVEDSVRVVATVGAPGVTVTTDDNVQPFVKVRVENGELVIDVDEFGWSTARIDVEVSNDRFEGLTATGASVVTMPCTSTGEFPVRANGASSVTVTSIAAANVKANANGASTVSLEGTSSALALEADGASTVRSQQLAATSATVRVDGASTVRVQANETITGSVGGSSTLEVFGSPARVEVETSGASTLRHAR